MIESGRSWDAAELAGAFLRLSNGGPSPHGLLRALLSRDQRFSEAPPGVWTALHVPRSTLEDANYLLTWVDVPEGSHPVEWRLSLRPHRDLSPGAPASVRLTGRTPDGWSEAHRRWSTCRMATLQPGPLHRLLQWTARRWAAPEWEEPLDLLTLARLALTQEGSARPPRIGRPHEMVAHWKLGPAADDASGVPFPALEAVLDHLLERYGALTEDEWIGQARSVLGTRPIPVDGFHFTLDGLADVTESSGVYRFFGDGDRLLYVGKALSLRRRLASYFRPLPAEASRREELLRQIRRFEVTPVPSELEALVLESRLIRTERPSWNVQVDVHPPDRLPPDWWWPLLYVAPGLDPVRATAVLLRGPDRGSLFHLPREAPSDEHALLEPLAERLQTVLAESGPWGENPGTVPSDDAGRGDWLDLDRPEARLALRFYLRERDRLNRVDSLHFGDGATLARALFELAKLPLGPGIPIDRRPQVSEGA